MKKGRSRWEKKGGKKKKRRRGHFGAGTVELRYSRGGCQQSADVTGKKMLWFFLPLILGSLLYWYFVQGESTVL